MRFSILAGAALALALFASSPARAVDYRVEKLAEPPPADELSAEIAGRLSPTGLRVIRGSSSTFCDIWLCQQLPIKADFEPTFELIYPFTPGQLFGVIRFARDAADFRDQEIEDGCYTLRYAQQPVDGSHVGTSLIRDFLLVLKAESDRSPETLDYDTLITDSSDAVGTSHPGMLSMQPVFDGETAVPSLGHNDDYDWWILATEVGVKSAAAEKLRVEWVMVGQGSE